MTILEKLRTFVRGTTSSRAPEEAERAAPPTEGTQAERLAEAMLTVEPDAAVTIDAEHETEHEPELEYDADGADLDLEDLFEPESIEVTDASHLARIETKPLPQPHEVVSPEEFSRTTDVLTEGMNQLREQLVIQTGRLEALVHNYDRLDEALRQHRERPPELVRLQETLDAFRAEFDATRDELAERLGASDAAREGLNGRLDSLGRTTHQLDDRMATIQQHQAAHAEQLKSQEGTLQQVGQRLVSFEHTHRESVKTIQQSIERLTLEVASLDRRTGTTRGLVLLAAVGACTAAALALIGLIAS